MWAFSGIIIFHVLINLYNYCRIQSHIIYLTKVTEGLKQIKI